MKESDLHWNLSDIAECSLEPEGVRYDLTVEAFRRMAAFSSPKREKLIDWILTQVSQGNNVPSVTTKILKSLGTEHPRKDTMPPKLSQDARFLLNQLEGHLKGSHQRGFYVMEDVQVIAFGKMLGPTNTIPPANFASGKEGQELWQKTVLALEELIENEVVLFYGYTEGRKTYVMNSTSLTLPTPQTQDTSCPKPMTKEIEGFWVTNEQNSNPPGSPDDAETLQVVSSSVFRENRFVLNERLVFMLSPFGDPFDTIFANHIKPTVEKIDKLICVRADNIYDNQVIIDDIWRLTNEARIIIADFTNKNANVFYETGLAHATGKEVIPITQSSEDVPFDLRHRRYILYENTHEGIEKLKVGLTNTITNILNRTKPARSSS